MIAIRNDNSCNWAPKRSYRVKCTQCVGQTINLGKVCARCLNREYPPHLVVWTGERWASRPVVNSMEG